MYPSDLDAALTWVRGIETAPVPTEWVPGASETERKHLAALASIAALLVDSSRSAGWPEPIRTWLNRAPAIPSRISAAIQPVLESNPDESLAALYAQLVGNKNRRVLGTFFTPADEVDLMVRMWSSTQPAPHQVIDVGAGVGVFTAAAMDAWPDAQMNAVDINPVTLGLLAARMTQHNISAGERSRLNLVLDDFTTWLPNARQPPGGRLIIGNPPYTRWQLIRREDRDRLVSASAPLCTVRSSLSALITGISLKQLRPQDGLCLLLPAQWLESDYAEGLRQFLINQNHRRVELRLVDSNVAETPMFNDARVDAVALLVGIHEQSEQPLVFSDWRTGDASDIQRARATTTGWRSLFPTKLTRTESASRDRELPLTIPLGKITRIRRGVATGANEFFLLSQEGLRAAGLTRAQVQPVIRRLSSFGDVADQNTFAELSVGERRWLLLASAEDRVSGGPLDTYVSTAERKHQYHERELCSRRECWFDLAREVFVPEVIFGAMSREKFRVVENAIGAAITNNLYGWTWRQDLSEGSRLKILAWLRSDGGQGEILQHCRRHADGLRKIEPRALGSVPIPAELVELRTVSDPRRETLLKARDG